MKSAYRIGDTLYLVETANKHRSTDTLYRGDGYVMDVSSYNNSSIIGFFLIALVLIAFGGLLIK